jgi:cold-inducible RNA-binding protein
MKKIFVGNLDFGVTEEQLRTLFAAHGQVDQVAVVTDRDSGQPRGFAFVEMSNDSEAEKAMQSLNGSDLAGRKLNVNEARPKVERGNRGDGGDHRGGFKSDRPRRGGGGGGGGRRY